MVEPSERPLILIVDDDDILRVLAVAALEGAGFEVIDTEGAGAGLAAFVARRPDLVTSKQQRARMFHRPHVRDVLWWHHRASTASIPRARPALSSAIADGHIPPMPDYIAL